MKYSELQFDDIGTDDLVVIYKGEIYPIYTYDNTEYNAYYLLSVAKYICSDFDGLAGIFFNEEGRPLEDLYTNGKLDAVKILTLFDNFYSLPKVLIGVVNDDEFGSTISFGGNGNYDVATSEELRGFLVSGVSDNFYKICVNGMCNTKKVLLSDLSNVRGRVTVNKTLYHGTSLSDAINIVRKGLRPNDDGYVLMVTSFDGAECLCQTETEKCVLEIDADRLNQDKLSLDLGFSEQFSSDYSEKSFNFRGGVTKDSKRNGTKYSKVGYNGIVYPNAIKSVYVFNGGWKKMHLFEFMSVFKRADNYEWPDINESAAYYIKKNCSNNMNSPVFEVELDYNSPRMDEVSYKDINLSSFKIKDELNPKFWINGKLNSRVRVRLLDIAEDFIEQFNVGWVKPKDIVLTGSIANYNWSKYSDIDVHVVMDFSKVYEKTEFVEEYFNAEKKAWNNDHDDITIYGFSVELYVEDVKNPATSSGVYSLMNNKWVVEPKDLNDASLNKDYVKKESAKFMTDIDELKERVENTDDDGKLKKLYTKAKKILKHLKDNRKKGLATKAQEMSSGNIIWKVLRRQGYIEKISNCVDDIYDKIKSID